MAANTWTANPGWTPQQVEQRFGRGARLVQRGGKWTIAGGTATGTVTSTPPRITDGFQGPAAGVVGPAPPAATPPAAIPPPAAPPPVSFGQQSNIANLVAQRAGLSGVYNPQRQALYTEGSRGLTDQGYYDTAAPIAVTTDPVTGAVSYQVSGRGEGRVARDTRGDINAGANSRGTLYSSATRATQRQSATALQNARESALRGLAENQSNITRQQTSDFTGLSGQIGQAQGDYADWRSSQAVPPPPPASESLPAIPGPPTPPAAPELPRVIRNPGAGSIPGLRRRGYVQRGNTWVRS